MHRDKKKHEGFQEWQPAFARSHIRTVGSPIATKQAEMYQESVRNTLSSHCCGVIVTVSSLPHSVIIAVTSLLLLLLSSLLQSSHCHSHHIIMVIMSS